METREVCCAPRSSAGSCGCSALRGEIVAAIRVAATSGEGGDGGDAYATGEPRPSLDFSCVAGFCLVGPNVATGPIGRYVSDPPSPPGPPGVPDDLCALVRPCTVPPIPSNPIGDLPNPGDHLPEGPICVAGMCWVFGGPLPPVEPEVPDLEFILDLVGDQVPDGPWCIGHTCWAPGDPFKFPPDLPPYPPVPSIHDLPTPCNGIGGSCKIWESVTDLDLGLVDVGFLIPFLGIGANCNQGYVRGGDGGTSLYVGGKGGDAVLDRERCIGGKGSDGTDGSLSQCTGGNGSGGGQGAGGTAQGGKGGTGGFRGGDGGVAEARGGPGGPGGRGGNGFLSTGIICTGGNGRNGGTGGSVNAYGGDGGPGNCHGGAGGTARAVGGAAGTGGPGGIPGGATGSEGAEGTATMVDGRTGTHSFPCNPSAG